MWMRLVLLIAYLTISPTSSSISSTSRTPSSTSSSQRLQRRHKPNLHHLHIIQNSTSSNPTTIHKNLARSPGSDGTSHHTKPLNHTHLLNTIIGSSSLSLNNTSLSSNSSSKSSYRLTSESTGHTFFDNWDFFSENDPTNGMVDYTTQSEAWASSLVSVGPSSIDPSFTSAVMRVDNSTWLSSGQHRKSVRLTSKKSFKFGLLVLDVIKIPHGCSTWPAFWTVGSNWPLGGEIDIVEGVNMLTTNQMTLHTGSGCSLNSPMAREATGKVLDTNCDVSSNGNAGCGVTDLSPESYGQPFNANKGGVFVMEWTSEGISIWRFNRSEIPQDLLTGKPPVTSEWSQPAAHWSNDGCGQLSDGFSAHQIIFDITLCGDWAGSQGAYTANGQCSGTCSDMITQPGNFDNAVWEVASVKLYEK